MRFHVSAGLARDVHVEIPIMGPLKRLLIIDDEPTILEVLRQFFETRYEVATANNPATGMFIASQRPFDVILLDISMPGMNGLELAAAIRDQGNDAAILFMTGYPSRRNVDATHKLGAVACLAKPTDLHELDKLVAHSARRQSSVS